MICIVTGGRTFSDRERLFSVLDSIHAATPMTLLVHGSCHLGGADILAEEWAKEHEVDYRGFPAKFKTGKLGKQEGPIRNGRMVRWVAAQSGEKICAGFPGGTGTADCLRQAKAMGIECREVRG